MNFVNKLFNTHVKYDELSNKYSIIYNKSNNT